MKYNTLKFELNEEEGRYVLTDIISYHTMFQDYPINHTPECTISHHGIEEYSTGYGTDIHNEYQFVTCKDFKGMDWYINEIAIPYEADVSKWKELMLKVLEADEDVSKNDLKELFG